MDTNCKLYFKRDNVLQLCASNSLVDYQLPCPPLKKAERFTETREIRAAVTHTPDVP